MEKDMMCDIQLGSHDEVSIIHSTVKGHLQQCPQKQMMHRE